MSLLRRSQSVNEEVTNELVWNEHQLVDVGQAY